LKAPDFAYPRDAIFLFEAALLLSYLFSETFFPETLFVEILFLARFLAMGRYSWRSPDRSKHGQKAFFTR